ncbi:MAG: dehydrogenase [Candidatus Abyssobacteria bacterium SURF_17]|uniref:Dehydrogenase n=1 Tax=Candidatus Abyssobacteria bacterium SURF_17 TaxID=2093361 RepID=A0A419ESV6_9BACT|nr:MAG: dehydrogenase [Candidatus Abyssubacteria bacterium SURF_17]
MGLSKQELLNLYESMQRLRKFEEEVSVQFAGGNIPGFVHLYTGQEAVAVGVCASLRPDDYITSTHRGHGHLIAKGGDLNKMMAELYGKETGYCRGRGGSMHIVDVSLGILGANGIVAAGTQIAAGAGLSTKVLKSGKVVACFFGDDATTEGMFHESMNLASVWDLPVIFVCENNLYGQFTPYAKHSKVRDIAERARAYGMPGVIVDGNDVVAVKTIAQQAVERARSGKGPTLIECKTYRWHGHYEGDVYSYRSEEEVEEWKKKCPIANFRTKLVTEDAATNEELDAIDRTVDDAIKAAIKFAEESPSPDPATVKDNVFSPETISEKMPSLDEADELPLALTIQETLREEMRRDPTVVLLGEDVTIGVFGVTSGLASEFGEERVLDTPISENVIAGAAVGAAMTGLRPVAEIEFSDFLTCSMDPIINQAAKLRFMTGGQVKMPLVIRTNMGAGFSAAAQHSQSPEALLMHVPGLVIAVPSTPRDAKGLLKTAIRSDNPVLFFESKSLYFSSGPVPKEDYTIPFGKADVKRPGKDVTVVAVSAMVNKSLSVAEKLQSEGISVEVIDPRTLVPLDIDTIISSVKKTGRLVIVEEGCLTGGFGAEVAARVAKEAFDYLDAPIERVAALDTPVPFSPILEQTVIPNEERIENAVRALVGE